MRKPMIAGNWKLNKTLSEAKKLATELAQQCQDIHDRDIVIAPVYTVLSSVAEAIKNSPVQLAAQNCYPEDNGAFTGEISPSSSKMSAVSWLFWVTQSGVSCWVKMMPSSTGKYIKHSQSD